LEGTLKIIWFQPTCHEHFSVILYVYSMSQTRVRCHIMVHHESNYVALTCTIHKWHQPGKTGGVNSKLVLYTLAQKIHEDTIGVTCP